MGFWNEMNCLVCIGGAGWLRFLRCRAMTAVDDYLGIWFLAYLLVAQCFWRCWVEDCLVDLVQLMSVRVIDV